ncbi:MAG: DDE-type integrase/transposase/recombinase [Thermoplasmata archaeon]
MHCKSCQSEDVIKWGRSRGRQRFKCKSCKKTFLESETPSDKSTKKKIIATALQMYYSGTSVRDVVRCVKNTFQTKVYHVTVWKWVQEYGKKANNYLKDYTVEVGGEFHADETCIKCNGEKTWYWEVIDLDTRFILSTHLSESHRNEDAVKVFKDADKRADRKPDTVGTFDARTASIENADYTFERKRTNLKLKNLDWGFDKIWYSRYKNERPTFIHETGIRGKNEYGMDNNVIERFHGNLKDRYKVMRGLGEIDSAKKILDGWVVHYNFFRPHMGLDDKTPAKAGGIELGIENV